MRYIKRKTNVRRHNRECMHKVADVRMHERNLKPRAILGIIPLKSLTYPQAKRVFPSLEPYGDIDEDKVINKRDCRPFDVDEQDELDWGKSIEKQDDLDESIKPVLTKLNDAGYKTLYSCSGLEEEHCEPVKEQPYIVFKTKSEKQKTKIEQAAKAHDFLVEPLPKENIIDKALISLNLKEKETHPLGANLVIRGDIEDSDEEKIKKIKDFEKELIKVERRV